MNLKDLYLDKKKKSIILDELEFEGNERVELLIYLAKYIGVGENIEKYYLLLGGRELITKPSFNNSDYMIENARKILKTLNQKKVYTEAKEEYDEDADGTNIYVKIDNQYLLKEDLNEQLRNKEELYYRLLNLEIKYKEKDKRYGFLDNHRYGISIEELPVEIELLLEPSPIKINLPKTSRDKKVKVRIEDIIKNAKTMDDKLSPYGNKYRENIIQNNNLKIIKNGKLENTETVELKELTNIIGQVGAGKSTFADALTNYLASIDKKVMVILPSVNKVFEKCREYELLGKNVVPIIGSSMWQSHIEKAIDGKDYLKEYESRVLTSACILGGLIKDPGISIRYGEEPCNKIYKFIKNGKTLNKSTRYVCPYYYQCPRTQVYKEIFDANVIVTTSAGLSSMDIGMSGISVFQFTLDCVDLLIVDEAESELNKLDQIFAPIISYDEYITSNGNLLGEHYSSQLEYRAAQKENIQYIKYYYESEKAFTQIYNSIKSSTQGFSISQLKNPFSARSLINSNKVENLLSEDLSKYLNEFVGKNIDKLSLRNLFDMSNTKELNKYLKNQDIIKLNLKQEEINMIIFIIAVLYFEHNYREMSNLVEGNDKLPLSTKAILSQRFQFQQRYIPVDPRGNIFKLQYKEDSNKSDLFVVKQFALGRSMYLKFPYLKLDSNGNPIGPKVLFLSGSSLAPGSFSNHINEKVDYILEAESYKTRFISNSYFEFYDCGVNVSGSIECERNDNLRKLVTNCKELILDKLNENKPILMIVNSYEDAKIVYKKLGFLLKDTEFSEDISYLIPDSSNDTESGIKYSDVSNFDKTNYKIFIAAAILIERGHNIVDIYGNSSFDVLMYLTRPMSKPNDYTNHVCKVNGHIMSEYSNVNNNIDLELFSQMMGDAYKIYWDLQRRYTKLSDLPYIYQKDIMVTLFTMILQIFGRLCRIGKEDSMKDESPEVYFLDGAFKSNLENGFDFLNRLVDYLEELINTEGDTGEIAKTLYLPFYKSLKKGKNIYGTKNK